MAPDGSGQTAEVSYLAMAAGSANGIAGLCHDASGARHPVFYQFRPWRGFVPRGFWANFLGVLTNVSFCTGYERKPHGYVETSFPCFQEEFEEFEEYFEWVDLLEAVTAASREFTMLELGAGWGRWSVNAAVALHKYSGLPYRLIAVEAEPTHFRWMTEHFRTNGIEGKNVQLVEAAVASEDGTVGFYIAENPYGGPADWYGQSIGGSASVRAISLRTLLAPLDQVDLIDADLQGAELEVFSSAIGDVDAKVKRIHLGTHSPKIEEELRQLFGSLGWEKRADFPCLSLNPTPYGTIKFQDGVQSWINPKFGSSQTPTLRANHLLDTVGFALELDPGSPRTEELLREGVLKPHVSELLFRIVRKGDTCIEVGDDSGYFACLMARLADKTGFVYALPGTSSGVQQVRSNLELNAMSGRAEVMSIHQLQDLLQEEAVSPRLLRIETDSVTADAVLTGAANKLTSHSIDFVLLCASKPEDVVIQTEAAKRLLGAGYSLWEQRDAGWAQATGPASGCDWLFASHGAERDVPTWCLAGSFARGGSVRQELANRNRFLETMLEKERQTPPPASREKPTEAAVQTASAKDSNLTPELCGDASVQLHTGFSPGLALWNCREQLAELRPRIEDLYGAVGCATALSLYQWAQLTACVLEYQPDLIVELGREYGNSTACFLESVQHLQHKSRVLSLCLSSSWRDSTVKRLRTIVAPSWFEPGEILEQNILTYDFESALQGSQRCLVFWDAHGFDVAECVLGNILPLLAGREHVVVMHDLSDLRFVQAPREYNEQGLWKGHNATGPAMWLGWIASKVAQSISVLDFASRNGIKLHSGDESINRDLTPEQRRVLLQLLGPELALPESHWFWFTLLGAEQKLTFPRFSAPQFRAGAENKVTDQMISLLELQESLGWRLLERFRSARDVIAPAGSLARRALDHALQRFRSNHRD